MGPKVDGLTLGPKTRRTDGAYKIAEDYLILDGTRSSDPAREQNLRARLLITFESLQPELTSINLVAETTRFDVCAFADDRQLDKREN